MSITAAIITALEAGPLTVGDGVKPVEAAGWEGDPGNSRFLPYVVVHAMPGGAADGSVDAPYADSQPLYQLSSYGESRDQCERVASRAHAVMLSASLSAPGVKALLVDVDVLGGAVPINDVQPPIWQSAYRYRIRLTPT